MAETTTEPTKAQGGQADALIASSELQRKGLSIKFKLSFAIAFLVTLSLATLAYFILSEARDALIAETTNRGILIGRNMAANSTSAVLQRDPLGAAMFVPHAMKNDAMVYAVLVDENSKVLAAPRGGPYAFGQKFMPPPGEIVEVSGQVFDGKVEAAWDPESEKDILAFSFPIVRAEVLLGHAYVGLSQSQVQKVVTSVTKDVILLSAAFLAIAFVGALFLATVITRPVEKLTAGAMTIGGGNLDYKIKVRSRDEMGVLASAFNSMTGSLKKAQEELVEKRLLKQELNIAHEIQFGLLPKNIPEVKGYEIVAFYEPAKEVGGDYYDFIQLGGKRMAFTVADVSGKGIPGSMGMTMARSVLRDQAFSNHLPGETMRRTNEVIQPDIRRGMFVTMFYCVLDKDTHKIHLANAGHNPALLFKADKSLEEIGPEGMALGLVPAKQYYVDEASINLAKGDTFVLYTDGVTEAMNLEAEEYGEPRFYQSIKDNDQADLDAMLKALVDDVLNFAGDAPRHDDITLLMIRRVS